MLQLTPAARSHYYHIDDDDDDAFDATNGDDVDKQENKRLCADIKST